MTRPRIVLAGGTGDLGGRIARELIARGADVRAIVRPGIGDAKTTHLRALGATCFEAQLTDRDRLSSVMDGAQCVVSALSGLHDVIVTAQSTLLDAALDAGVSRFIPSNFSISFHQVPAGSNRNIDLRREFMEKLDRAAIRPTTIFCGSFETLLLMSGPFIAYSLRRVFYWEDADHHLDFTHMDDVARYTAAAALDSDAPPELHIVSGRTSARELSIILSELSGKPFKLSRLGSERALTRIISVLRTVYPQSGTPFSVWQGLQYIRNMFDIKQTLSAIDNERYPGTIRCTLQVMLSERLHR